MTYSVFGGTLNLTQPNAHLKLILSVKLSLALYSYPPEHSMALYHICISQIYPFLIQLLWAP